MNQVYSKKPQPCADEDVVEIVRPVLEQIAQKWSILVLATLCSGPKRFNALKRSLGGITQKALTDTLRRLERSGLVDRRVIIASPIAVEYSVTPLGRTLEEPFRALFGWATDHRSDLERAQSSFDTDKNVLDLAARRSVEDGVSDAPSPGDVGRSTARVRLKEATS